MPVRCFEKKMTHFPKYLNLNLRREFRISGVTALSKRIVEIPLTNSVKIMGVRYEVSTVITRQELGIREKDGPVVHYYTYSKNLATKEWYGYLNGVVIRMEKD